MDAGTVNGKPGYDQAVDTNDENSSQTLGASAPFASFRLHHVAIEVTTAVACNAFETL